ncbi:MAG: acyl carrier protein [Oscillatoria sp. PMC 1051.18]|nr:acyl carrier protein [Oscillatoria sp. PMC 1050.18]MEC5029898.1 acyl carrier protein [Oscillatoria sp. PMC 1051.18]
MSKKLNIEKLVLKLLHYYICLPSEHIPSLQSRLVEDLQAGDDLLDFILEIQSQLNLKIPISSWEKVRTVQDIIDLVKQYTNKCS